MTGLVRGRGRRRAVRQAAAVSVAYVFAGSLARWVADAVGVSFPVTPGLVLSLGLLLGPVVAWGAGLGYLLTAIVRGTFGPETVVGFLAQFVLVLVGVRLWGTFGRFSSGEVPGVASARNLFEFSLLACTAALVLGGLTAWGAVVSETAPFATVVGDSVVGSLSSMLTVGVAVLYLGARVRKRDEPVLTERVATGDGGRPQSSSAGRRVFLVALGWTVVGFWLGLVFQAAQLQRTHVLVNRLGRLATWVLELAGPGGYAAQAVVGVVCLGTCLAILYRREIPSPDR